MKIREFRLPDYDEVVKLWTTSGLIIRPGDERDGIRLKLQRDPDLFLLAVDRDEIVGVVMGAWDGRRGWINHLAVKPNHRRTGVGRKLIGELEKRLKMKGARRINAQIYAQNTVSLNFFESLGYEIRRDLVMVGKPLKQRN